MKRYPVSRMVVILLIALSGCQTYDEKIRKACNLYYTGHYTESRAEWAKLKSSGDGDNDPLFDLELGMVNFTDGDYEASSRALESADSLIEIIDFTSNPREIGKYIFSESSGLYKSPPHEKIFLSILNLLNYAAQGKLKQARTEANLLYSKVDGLKQLEDKGHFESALAYIMVGILDEIAQPRRPGVAQASYAKAEAIMKRELSPQVKPNQSPGPDEGELVTVVLNGRSPVFKCSNFRDLPAEERKHYKELLIADVIGRMTAMVAAAKTARSKKKQPSKLDIALFVNANLSVPQLKLAMLKKRYSQYSNCQLTVSGQETTPLEKVLDLEKQVMHWYNTPSTASAMNLSPRQTHFQAAISRMAIRIASGLLTQMSTQEKMGDSGAQLLGFLANRFLYALDTPDTRCWNLLPREVFFERRILKQGEYDLSITLSTPSGNHKKLPKKSIQIEPGKFNFAIWVCHD